MDPEATGHQMPPITLEDEVFIQEIKGTIAPEATTT
jgi:hypothetical protein